MTIRIWQSFACNNSSSFRLVARFATVEAAAAVDLELRTLLANLDAMLEQVTRPDEVPDAALAARCAMLLDIHDWTGAEHPPYDGEIELATSGEVLVAYHHYCLGFPTALSDYLRASGAHAVEKQRMGAPTISLLFTRVASLDADLDDLFHRIAASPGTGPLAMPWGNSPGRVTAFRDVNTVGLFARIEPADIPACRRWFSDRGAAPVIHMCEDADEPRFAAIAAARCTSCTGPLEYLDPRLHDIESPQLLCRPCGGLYDLATFMAA